jgi:plasmid stabilization system protein ParE
VWSLEYSIEAERDFELIFDYLFAVYSDLGEHPDEALEHAAGRIRELRVSIGRLAETPHIGTSRSDIYPGIRFLRRDKAEIWFLPVVDRQMIVIAAIFFGAQDHIRHMMRRLLDS